MSGSQLVEKDKKEGTSVSSSHVESQAKESFADKFFASITGALNVQTAYIGYKLGWYTALAETKLGLTCTQLAKHTHTSERYAQEWLEMQTVAGWVACVDPSISEAKQRVYWLPADRAQVLANPDSLTYYLPLASLQVGTVKVVDQLIEAYRNDTGVSWSDMGDDAREAQAHMNRPFFLQALPSLLEDALDPATVTKLHSTGGKIADIGAGFGWSCIGLAQHFKASRVDLYDLDAPSVQSARVNIAQYGLTHRITTHCEDAAVAAQQQEDAFDLVLALECIHDMADPISVLKTMRELAASSGTVIVMDELTNERFSADPNPLEHFLYGISCVCCLPDGKSAGKSSVATGGVMRPSLFRMYAQQAGFKEVEILPMDNDLFRFYKLIL
eukprot:scaffold1390_cov172-Amphora_coffeaeformis.AAC.15